MNIHSCDLIYFSPTKTTRTILESIASGLGCTTPTHFNFTPPDFRSKEIHEKTDSLAIIGTPVYSGRIPLKAIERMKGMKVDSVPAVIVVLYGNREYEDALLELKDLASQSGFIPVAGGAFIGEHSFSNENTPIAVNRPDSKDLKTAVEFGARIRKKIESVSSSDAVTPVDVPGNSPYKERPEPSHAAPITKEDLCTLCETCATVCPTAAITVNDRVDTESENCISCCACVKNCPTGARVMEDTRIIKTAEWLHTNCFKRKEPEIYL